MLQIDRANTPSRQDSASWRDTLSIHPAAEMFPLMAPSELAALGADIKTNGLINPIVLWLASKDAQAQLLDGRSRLDAIEIALGGPVRVTSRTARGCTVWVLEADDNGCPTSVANLLGCASCSLDTRAVIVLDPGLDPYVYVISANIRRRHLNTEEREKILFELIARTPEKSDRQLAKEVGVDHKTIGRARAKGEDVGRIPHVETRTDTKGRQQPAKKVTAKPSPVSEEVLRQRSEAAERIRSIRPHTADDASGNASDEQVQLRHFEFQNIALRSEIEELKAQVRDLEDRGLRAVPLAKLLDEVGHQLPPTLPKKHVMAFKALRGELERRHFGATLDLSPVTDREATKH